MKKFFKYVFATVVGIFVFGIILFLFGLFTIVSSVLSGEDNPIKDNSVLVIDLNGTLDERVEENPFAEFMGGTVLSQTGLDDMLNAIEKAKKNDDIKGIFIQAGVFAPDSWASAQAVRKALTDFRKCGKWIVSYGDTYSQPAYYIASCADEILLNPNGEIDWHGIGGNPMFIKDLLAKVGIKMQLAKVGTYKSAPEMFVADKMSDANREQTMAYMTSIWNNILKDVSKSRNIVVDSLNVYADGYTLFDDQKTLVKRHLVDRLAYADEAKADIMKRLGIKGGNKILGVLGGDEINQVTVSDLKTVDDNDSGEEIAVYYAFGDIVQTSEQGMLGGGSHQIVAQDVCKDLERLAADENVKAVVLRINSGGGSAYASEQLWRSIELLKKQKPVVVSMGGMAASGGYYMSCNSNWIVAEPTTVTGSIGIFGMFPDFSELYTQKLGIKFDEVKTNKNATFGNTTVRPINDEEMAMLERYVQRGYQLFIKRVGDGRHMTTAQVDAIGQGHVYTAEDALKIKLVDELGGLDAAISKAAKLAKVKKYHRVAYPEPADWLTQLLESTTGKGNGVLDSKIRSEFGELYEPIMFVKTIKNQDRMQARIPFIMEVK